MKLISPVLVVPVKQGRLGTWVRSDTWSSLQRTYIIMFFLDLLLHCLFVWFNIAWLDFSRIGNLSASDAAAQAEELAASDNPFAGKSLQHLKIEKNNVTLQAILNATLP